MLWAHRDANQKRPVSASVQYAQTVGVSAQEAGRRAKRPRRGSSAGGDLRKFSLRPKSLFPQQGTAIGLTHSRQTSILRGPGVALFVPRPN